MPTLTKQSTTLVVALLSVSSPLEAQEARPRQAPITLGATDVVSIADPTWFTYGEMAWTRIDSFSVRHPEGERWPLFHVAFRQPDGGVDTLDLPLLGGPAITSDSTVLVLSFSVGADSLTWTHGRNQVWGASFLSEYVPSTGRSRIAPKPPDLAAREVCTPSLHVSPDGRRIALLRKDERQISSNPRRRPALYFQIREMPGWQVVGRSRDYFPNPMDVMRYSQPAKLIWRERFVSWNFPEPDSLSLSGPVTAPDTTRQSPHTCT